ncbi:MAG: hypothetical protein ACPGWR_02070, partial [Ardenticatenaceae bacterium]
ALMHKLTVSDFAGQVCATTFRIHSRVFVIYTAMIIFNKELGYFGRRNPTRYLREPNFVSSQ